MALATRRTGREFHDKILWWVWVCCGSMSKWRMTLGRGRSPLGRRNASEAGSAIVTSDAGLLPMVRHAQVPRLERVGMIECSTWNN